MRALRIAFGLAAWALAACGGGGGDGGNDGPTPPPPPSGSQTLGSITTNVTSLSMTAGEIEIITVTALDTENKVIASIPTPSFTSQNDDVVEVSATGQVIAVGAGQTTIGVSVTRNGITKTAQVAVTVTGQLPQTATVVASSADYIFTPRDVVIRAGGSVDWTFGSLEHTVYFQGGAGAPANIASGLNTTVSRSFSQTGNFAYSCTIHPGMSGTVIVR
ncbi:MAG TPA: hypothetical protein VF178_01115 [Gemmatimonadaceae bacterium]